MTGSVDPANPDWINTAEAAQILGVTPRTLYRMINLGQVPAFRFGRVIRLRRAEVLDSIERARIRPGELGDGLDG